MKMFRGNFSDENITYSELKTNLKYSKIDCDDKTKEQINKVLLFIDESNVGDTTDALKDYCETYTRIK